MAKTPLIAVPGIGEATSARLEAAGIKSAEALVAAAPTVLAGLPGFMPARAERVLAAARELLGVTEPARDKAGKKKGTGKKSKAKGKGAKADATKEKKKATKKDKGKKGKKKKSKDKKKQRK